MRTSFNRERGDSYLILLWLPIAGGLVAAAAVFLTSGRYGFDLLWVRWTPGVIGFLVFVALFALLAAFYLLRGLFRWMNRVAAPHDAIQDIDESTPDPNKSDLNSP
jgi:hypothetical protein